MVSRWDAEGECFLSPEEVQGRVVVLTNSKVPLHIKGNVTVTGQGNVTGTGQGNVTVTGQGNLTETGQGNVTVTGQSDVTVTGQNRVGVDRRVGNLSSDRWDKEEMIFFPGNGQTTDTIQPPTKGAEWDDTCSGDRK